MDPPRYVTVMMGIDISIHTKQTHCDRLLFGNQFHRGI
jgi:hypothetical protein